MRTKIWSEKIVTTNPFVSGINITGPLHGWCLRRQRSDREFQVEPSSHVNHRDTDIPKIVFLLEDKVGSRKVTEKVKDKAFTLSDEQTRLIASLAELTANSAQAAGAELVFLVITILIIVS